MTSNLVRASARMADVTNDVQAVIGNDQNYGYGAEITLAPTSGSVGTFVVVTGIGFGDSGGCPISSFPIGLVTHPICALDLGTEEMSGSFIVGNVPLGHYLVQAGYDGSAVAGFNVTSPGSSSTTISSTLSQITTSSGVASSTASSELTTTTYAITVTKTMQIVIPTSLSIVSNVGESIVVTVTLTGSSHGLVGPISSETVSVASKWSGGSCMTKLDGTCQVTLSKPTKGSYSIIVTFAGNSYFSSSTVTEVIVVK